MQGFFKYSTLLLIENKMYAKHEKFLNKLFCDSPVIEFSKEQNKLSISTVYHNCYCYRTFLSSFEVRPLSYNLL